MCRRRTCTRRCVTTVYEDYEDVHYNFQGKNSAPKEDDKPEVRKYIIGSTTLAFPTNQGWAPAVQNPDPLYSIKKSLRICHLTIKKVTKLITVTEQIKDSRPNCEKSWQLRIGFTIPYEEIWPLLGTPLSDAMEEKEWCKLLQRAIYVRNRDSDRIKARTTSAEWDAGA